MLITFHYRVLSTPTKIQIDNKKIPAINGHQVSILGEYFFHFQTEILTIRSKSWELSSSLAVIRDLCDDDEISGAGGEESEDRWLLRVLGSPLQLHAAPHTPAL